MTLTTATLGDHLAAQGVEANEFYSRGGRIRKREAAVDANSVVAPTEFLAEKVVTLVESVPTPRTARCAPACPRLSCRSFSQISPDTRHSLNPATHDPMFTIQFTEWGERWCISLTPASVANPPDAWCS